MGKKVCIETFGCQMNVHDSERILGLLEEAGYELTSDLGDADLVVVNTCSVRERAEDKLYSRLGAISAQSREKSPLIAVTGCVAQQEGENLLNRTSAVDVVVGTRALRRLPVLIKQAEETNSSKIDINPYENVSFPLGIATRNDSIKAFVTIIEGCNDFCAFCVVPYTRGPERMRPAGEILAEVREAAGKGHKEIHLLGQIVNHYKAPDLSGCDFAKLLELVHQVPGVERIRFASPHPRHVSPRMINAIRDLPKICKHLHLPVQSGSSNVLKRMRRRYSRAEYLELVQQIRETIPNIALSTDMIIGFPGESPSDFNDTLSLAKLVRYQSMFSFKYSERPNTLAAKRMPDSVEEPEKTRRLTELQKLQKDIQVKIHSAQLGKKVSVLVDSRSKRRNQKELSGRTCGNTVVNFPGNESLLGQTVSVLINRTGANSLSGKIIKE